MKGIGDLGFSDLFPIQAQAIQPLLEGKDVIGQAQTGTGKTAAFGIPMVENVNPRINSVQGLILVPTRELAVQVADNMRLYSKYAGLKVLPVYGGESINRQIRALKRGAQIIVGTPGRMIDLIKRGMLTLGLVKSVVLDEADRMLDMGFIEDIEYILSKVPRKRQTGLFSATITQSVMGVCNRFMNSPEKIFVSKDEIALLQIKQYYMIVDSRNKFRILCDLLNREHVKRAIIFCKTRIGTSRIADRLRRKGFNVEALHGGFTQSKRNSIVNYFRKGKLNLLVATDVAARGLDIKGITHILNYDVPLEAPVYFHRIGRTARMGQNGTAITLVERREMNKLNEIKSLTKTKMEKIACPRSPNAHIATCSKCGEECEIPFKPDLGRPVYCQKCWEDKRQIHYINVV
jgi:ATP-dependent RNA helicase DeaD